MELSQFSEIILAYFIFVGFALFNFLFIKILKALHISYCPLSKILVMVLIIIDVKNFRIIRFIRAGEKRVTINVNNYFLDLSKIMVIHYQC